MRPDQTDPDTIRRDVPVRTDDMTALPRRERAGSPNPAELEGSSWQDIKGRFVDDPAGALAAAEEMVERAVEQRCRALKDEATALRAKDADTSTESLRTRLIRYQEYCERR